MPEEYSSELVSSVESTGSGKIKMEEMEEKERWWYHSLVLNFPADLFFVYSSLFVS